MARHGRRRRGSELKRVTDLAQARRWVSSRVEAAGLRSTSRRSGVPLSTVAKRVRRHDWTVEELAKLAPLFGGRLFLEMPDDRPAGGDAGPRFYK
jgi:hypothetical protein